MLLSVCRVRPLSQKRSHLELWSLLASSTRAGRRAHLRRPVMTLKGSPVRSRDITKYNGLENDVSPRASHYH